MCCWLPVRLSMFTLHYSPLSKMMDSTVWSPPLGWVWPVGVLVRDGGRKKVRLGCLSATPSVWSLFRLIVSLTSLLSGCFSVCDSLASPSVLVQLSSGAAATLNDPKSRQHPLWLSRLSLTQYRCKYPPDCVHACQAASVLPDSVITCTAAHQAPLSTGFCRQKYWSGLPSPPPGDLSDPGIEPVSLTSPALAGGLFITSTAWEAPPSSLLLLNTSSLLTWVGRCWRRSLRRHDCRVTGDLGPGSLRLFIPSQSLKGMFSPDPHLWTHFKTRTQTWESHVLLRPSGQSMWLNQGEGAKEARKTPVGGSARLRVLWPPRTSLVCEFLCSLNLPPASWELRASSASSCPLCVRTPRLHTTAICSYENPDW